MHRRRHLWAATTVSIEGVMTRWQQDSRDPSREGSGSWLWMSKLVEARDGRASEATTLVDAVYDSSSRVDVEAEKKIAQV